MPMFIFYVGHQSYSQKNSDICKVKYLETKQWSFNVETVLTPLSKFERIQQLDQLVISFSL